MSEHKQAGVVASVNTGMVVGGRRQHRPMRLHVKVWGLVLFTALVLGSAGWLLYGHFHHTKAAAKVISSQKGSQASGPSTPDISSFTQDQKAQYYLGQRNYGAAESIYKDELKAAGSNDAKVQAYINLSDTYLDAADYSQAYQYAVQADALASSEQTANLVANAARQNGDKKNAAKYYQLAIDRLDKTLPEYNFDLSELQVLLKEVSN